MIIELTNFRPPTVNHIYRRLRGGKTFKTSKYRDLFDTAKKQLSELNHQPTDQKLFVKLSIKLKGKRNIDLDNMAKWIDIFNKILWVDDSQIYRMQLEKTINELENKTTVTICNHEDDSLLNNNTVIINI
jgi:Holliday junction resolvase RusA-like endonuclease